MEGTFRASWAFLSVSFAFLVAGLPCSSLSWLFSFLGFCLGGVCIFGTVLINGLGWLDSLKVEAS